MWQGMAGAGGAQAPRQAGRQAGVTAPVDTDVPVYRLVMELKESPMMTR